MNGKVLRNLSYGVYLVTSMDGLRPVGCVANSVMQITSDPAVVAVSIHHNNFTNGCIAKSGRLAVTILAEDSDPALIGRFGFQSSRDADKFSGLDFEMKKGSPVPAAGCGWFACEVLGSYETETHTVFFARLLDGEARGGAPMTYAYYHGVVKGKSPRNAPTYQPEEKPAASRWKCGVCGYVYEGEIPFEQLPDSYVCPVCRQPKSVFVRE